MAPLRRSLTIYPAFRFQHSLRLESLPSPGLPDYSRVVRYPVAKFLPLITFIACLGMVAVYPLEVTVKRFFYKPE